MRGTLSLCTLYVHYVFVCVCVFVNCRPILILDASLHFSAYAGAPVGVTQLEGHRALIYLFTFSSFFRRCLPESLSRDGLNLAVLFPVESNFFLLTHAKFKVCFQLQGIM